MLQFLPGAAWIAVGGLIAAAGPVLIHLLNRRRFKVIHWAAMDFLLQAVQRNRKILELRDIILLILRTACVLLIGLALAGPYFSCSSGGANPNDPLHAILIVDNGLSMGYSKGGRTLLDEAKNRAKTFIDKLPSRSRVTVIPLCGSANEFGLEPLATREDAKAALEKVDLVDRSVSMTKMKDIALKAMEKLPDLPAKRVVLFSDQLASKWPKGELAGEFKRIPDLQIVAIQPPAAEAVENSWIESFRLVDDFANAQAPATFAARVRHQGLPQSGDKNNGVEVVLTLVMPNGEVLTQNKVIDLLEENSEGREVRFTQTIPVTPKEGQPLFVSAKVSLPEDRLSADNARYLSVPVLAKVPVVFVDQLGKDENVNRNRLGETEPMRSLLTQSRRNKSAPQLFNVRHVKINELNRDLLQDARVVIIAGLSSPGVAMPDLEEYVRQGGQLLIGAGGEFDLAAWNSAAWRDGDGILPARLTAPVGSTSEEVAAEIKPFTLDYDSFSKSFAESYDNSEEQLRQFYSERLFFKAIAADVSQEAFDKAVEKEKQRLRENDATGREVPVNVNVSETTPTTKPEASAAPRSKLAELAERSRPRVVGKFTNNVPFLIERRVGKGRVMFLSTGMTSSWNATAGVSATWNALKSGDANAQSLFALLFEPLLKETLPQRTFDTTGEIKIPIAAADRSARFEVAMPGNLPAQSLREETLSDGEPGLVIRQVTQRGIYGIAAYHDDRALSAAQETQPLLPTWTLPVAVNGPADASELNYIKSDDLKDRLGDAKWHWVGAGDEISLEGTEIWGQHAWWILVLAVLVLLAIEMLVLAWPRLKQQEAVTA